MNKKYSLYILFANIFFVTTTGIKSGGAFLETPYITIPQLFVGWFLVFLLCVQNGRAKRKIMLIITYTALPYIFFGLFGAYYNVLPSICNMVVYYLLSFFLSSACIKCNNRIRYALLFSLFLHLGLSFLSYIITYSCPIGSFQKIYCLSPIQRFSILDIYELNIAELLFYSFLSFALYINPFNKNKGAVAIIVFVIFGFTALIADAKFIPNIKFTESIELELSLYDDYVIFYGNEINTRCVYEKDKDVAYDFILKAKRQNSTKNTILKNRKDKYFNVMAVFKMRDGRRYKIFLKDISLLSVEEELNILRKAYETRKNNPIYKSGNVNWCTVNSKLFNYNMYKLIYNIKKDVAENHINNTIFYDVKFHEIRDGRALKTICIKVGDKDVNTIRYLKACNVNHIYNEMPEKLNKYKLDFNFSEDTDFYNLMKDKEYVRESGYMSHNLIPFSPKGEMSQFFTYDIKNIYLPQPALENKIIFLEGQ